MSYLCGLCRGGYEAWSSVFDFKLNRRKSAGLSCQQEQPLHDVCSCKAAQILAWWQVGGPWLAFLALRGWCVRSWLEALSACVPRHRPPPILCDRLLSYVCRRCAPRSRSARTQASGGGGGTAARAPGRAGRVQQCKGEPGKNLEQQPSATGAAPGRLQLQHQGMCGCGSYTLQHLLWAGVE